MMVKRATNDNVRETKQAELFELDLRLGRSNKYTPDADFEHNGKWYDVELKTFYRDKSGVSTARGVKQKKIDEWRNVSTWIFSEYTDDNELTGLHYCLTAAAMEPFFVQVEEKLHIGSKTLAGLNDWAKAKSALENIDFDKKLLKKLDYAFVDKGCALNDPKIPLSYLQTHGTRIYNSKGLRLIYG